MTSTFQRKPGIDFSDIKASSSPFAIRKGEKVEGVVKERYHGFIDKYTITEHEKKVLKCVNFLALATSRQVYSLLSSYGITHDEIHRILTKLFNAGYLRKLEFSSDNSKSSYKVYMIAGGRGAILYQSVFEQKPNKITYMGNLSDPADFKRILACNQFMCQVGGICKTDIPSHFQVFSMKRFLQKPLLLRTSGYLNIDGKPVWIEGVRREDEYIDKLTERLNRHEKLIMNYKKLDEVFGTSLTVMPILLIVCEDEVQCREIQEVCSKSKIRDQIILTHDMALIGDFDAAFQTA